MSANITNLDDSHLSLATVRTGRGDGVLANKLRSPVSVYLLRRWINEPPFGYIAKDEWEGFDGIGDGNLFFLSLGHEARGRRDHFGIFLRQMRESSAYQRIGLGLSGKVCYRILVAMSAKRSWNTSGSERPLH